METMHFHMAQTGLYFKDDLLLHLWDPNEQFDTIKNCPWGKSAR